jgi:hypothetical protein
MRNINTEYTECENINAQETKYYLRKHYKRKSGNAGNRTRFVKHVGRCYVDWAISTMYPTFTSLSSPNFTSLIYFPNPLPEYKRFKEDVPIAPWGNQFQSAMVLFTTENFLTFALIFLDLIFQKWSTLSRITKENFLKSVRMFLDLIFQKWSTLLRMEIKR